MNLLSSSLVSGKTQLRIALVFSLALFGCAAPPAGTEILREVVLHHVGGDFGTVGPFYKDRKKELDVLVPQDRARAAALLDQGAAGFLIYQPGNAGAARIVLVEKDHVVGDFSAPAK